MSEVKFQLNRAEMLNMGGGSVTEFCRRFNIDRNLLNHVLKKSHVKSGTKSQALVEKLISMGVGRYVNVAEKEAAADGD